MIVRRSNEPTMHKAINVAVGTVVALKGRDAYFLITEPRAPLPSWQTTSNYTVAAVRLEDGIETCLKGHSMVEVIHGYFQEDDGGLS